MTFIQRYCRLQGTALTWSAKHIAAILMVQKKFENEQKEKRYECERKPRIIFTCYTRFSQTEIVDQSVSRILSHDDNSTFLLARASRIFAEDREFYGGSDGAIKIFAPKSTYAV